MRCGISTACFFPENTLEALRHVVELGAPVTELFLNTFRELEPDFIEKLYKVIEGSDTQVISVHPFSSSMEGFFFSTDYDGRWQDGEELYRRYFEVCRLFGAKVLVFHGDPKTNPAGVSDEDYAARFARLSAIGREYGVTLSHENVVYCRLHSPARVRQLRPFMGESAAFVLDTKQVYRDGSSVEDMLAAMQGAMRHVHISDSLLGADCLPPGNGCFDFESFLQQLAASGYKGDMVIEVYRQNFTGAQDLRDGMQYIQWMLERLGLS